MNPYYWIGMMALVSYGWMGVNRHLIGDFLSPFNLLLPLWIFPVLLCLLHLSVNEPVWSHEAVFLVGYYSLSLSFASLILPTLFLHWQKKSGRNKLDRLFLEMMSLLNRVDFTVYLLAFFLLGAAAAFYNEIISNPGGLALISFLRDGDLSRDATWHTKGQGLMWLVSIPVTTLGPLVYLRALGSRRKTSRVFFLCLAAIYPVIALLKLSRSDLFNYVFGCVLIHCWWRYHRLRDPRAVRRSSLPLWRKMVIGAVLLYAVFLSATLFQRIRSGTEQNRGVTQFASQTGIYIDLPPPLDAVVSEVYLYCAVPFHNFVYFVNEYHGGSNWGTGLLRPIYSATLQGESVQDKLAKLDYDSRENLHMLPGNTFPIIQQNYMEFGWKEVLIAPWVYATMMSLAYCMLRGYPHIVTLVLFYVMCSYQWIWMFCNSAFTGIQFYLYGLFVIPFWYGYKWFLSSRHKHSPSIST